MKNNKRSLFAAFSALFLAAGFTCLPVSASAAKDEEPLEYPEELFSGTECEYTLNGMTWDELAEDFMRQHEVKDWNVGFGYYNTVTGEEHFYNGDTYFVAASIYKLPLCMMFMEKIESGELDLEGKFLGYPLKELIRATIEASSNATAHTLLRIFNKPKQFVTEIGKYMGVDVEQLDPGDKYLTSGNFNFTPRQVMNCLRYMYDDPDGTYQLIMDHMLNATPGNYFLFHEQEVPVAHKYGYLEDGYLFVNDCGYCYTDDPICLVMYTKALGFTNRQVLADYCTLMIEYEKASREQRLEAEAAAAEEARIAEEQRLAEDQRLAEESTPAQPAAEQKEAAQAEAALQEAVDGDKRRITLIIVLSGAVVSGSVLHLAGKLRKKPN